RFLYDNTAAKHWTDMNDAERTSSSINTTNLVWDGPMTTFEATNFVGHRAHVVTSGAITGDFISGQGVFSPAITLAGITGQLVLVNDGVGLFSDGCNTPFVGSVSGKIALMDRSGSCSFAQQAANAQSQGAIAAIIINNVTGPEPPLRGSSPTVTIP